MRGASIRRFLGLAAVCLATQAQAAGPLDGIYQFFDWDEWLTVHQTGNHVVVGRFYVGGTTNWTLANGQKYTGINQGRWYLLSGDLAAANSTSVIIRGDSNGGACTSTYRIDLGTAQIWMEWLGATPTASGVEQGIDCHGNYLASTNNGINTWYKLTKIF